MGSPGKQWLSWIHVEDVAGMIQFAIEQPMIKGPLNVTAPEPMQMKDFGKTIGLCSIGLIGYLSWLFLRNNTRRDE